MAVNDNGDQPAREAPGGFDPVLVAALHHFARHGLDSARVAHAEATRARLEGNGPGAAEWAAITAMFDRRLAASAKSRSDPRLNCARVRYGVSLMR